MTIQEAAAILAKEPQHDVPCTGAAHSNPHIDNCMMCAPRQGVVSVSTRFASVQEHRDAIDALMYPGQLATTKSPDASTKSPDATT